MTNSELNKLTYMELLDLRRDIEMAISNYKNRNKTRCYTVFIEYEGTKYFVTKERAIEYVKECIEEGLLFDDKEAKMHQTFLTAAEIERYCLDYESTKK